MFNQVYGVLPETFSPFRELQGLEMYFTMNDEQMTGLSVSVLGPASQIPILITALSSSQCHYLSFSCQKNKLERFHAVTNL